MTVHQPQSDFNIWLHKFLSGAASGLVNSTIVTPINGYSNYLIDKLAGKDMRTFNPIRAFDGAMSYNVSLILRVGVGLSLNSLFLHKLCSSGEIEPKHKIWVSLAAGGLAGIFCTLPEGIAQAQQQAKPKPSAFNVIKNAYKSNGMFSLTRGTVAMMARSAGFSAGYLAFMPLLSEKIQQKIGNRHLADILSATVCGAATCVVTTPFNTLRSIKQANFTTPGAVPSYQKIMIDMYHSAPGLRGLFTASGPRTPMLIFLMYCLPKGNEICGTYVNEGIQTLNNAKLALSHIKE